jgi:hypothetical protein
VAVVRRVGERWQIVLDAKAGIGTAVESDLHRAAVTVEYRPLEA